MSERGKNREGMSEWVGLGWVGFELGMSEREALEDFKFE